MSTIEIKYPNHVLIDGYTFKFHWRHFVDGIIIDMNEVAPEDAHEFVLAATIANFLYDEYMEYCAESGNRGEYYTPKFKQIPAFVRSCYEPYVIYLLNIEANRKEQDTKALQSEREARLNPKPKVKTLSFVYLIKPMGADGHYKIGYSKDPHKRMVGLSTEYGKPLEMVHTIKTYSPYALEQSLHARYADKALGREWFALSPEDVQDFCNTEDEA